MALTTVPASLSATALTLTTAAQPNITSVGTLTGLTVSGNIAGTLTTAAQTNITSVGTLSSLTVSGALNGTLSTAAQTNITSVGTLSSLTVSGALNGTLSTAAQTNITSLGTLTSLNSTGDVTVTSGTSGKPHLNLINTNADSSAPVLNFKKDSASPADNDEVGRIYMWGDDDAGNPTEAFLAIGKMTDVSNGSEDSSLDLYTLAAGAQSATLTLKEGKVGIGTASPGNKLDIKGTVGFEATNSTNRWLAYTYTDNTYRLNYNGAGADEVVVDSSGRVGIGTSSPSSYYAKNFVVMADGDGTGGITIAAPATDDNTYLAFADGTSGAATYAGYVGYRHASPEYLFFGAGAETAMYVQGKTRVGIGNAPNANWRNDSTDRILTLGTEAAVHSDAGVTTELWNNAYVNNSDQFLNISTRGASRYMQYSGAHKWFTAASASAGSTINTEINSSPKMVLDVSGNLGIGTSSPSTYDSRANNLVVGDSGDAGITIFSGSTSNARLQFAPSGDTGLNNGLIDYDNNNDSMTFATAGSDRMTIDSSGAVEFYVTTGASTTGGKSAGVEIGTPASGGSLLVRTPSLNSGFSSGLIVDGAYSHPLSQVNLTASGVHSGGGYEGHLYLRTQNTTSIWNSIVAKPNSLDFYTANTPRMSIDSSGAITKPTQPAFSAYLAGSSHVTFNADTTAVLPASSEIFDQGADYNTSTYQFTAPVTGKYQFNAHVRVDGLDAGANYYIFYIRTSNRNYYDILDPNFSADLSYYTFQVSVLADMDANDVAWVEIYQAGGANQAEYNAGSGPNGFTGYLVA